MPNSRLSGHLNYIIMNYAIMLMKHDIRIFLRYQSRNRAFRHTLFSRE